MIWQEQTDTINMDEMTNGLCSLGEAYFQRGEFKEALDFLLRCIREPKSASTKLSETKSHYLLGRIYGYLGQEMLSKENLLKALELSQESGYQKEAIGCYISLTFFYAKREDFEQALDYQEKALQLIRAYQQKEPVAAAAMEAVCLAYRGIICAKQGQTKMSAECLTQVEHFAGGDCETSQMLPVLDLALRVSYEKQDTQTFEQCLKRLLEQEILEENFFENLEFYFDICIFLLEKGMQKEVRTLLDYIKNDYDRIPLAYLKYGIHNLELAYAKQYGDEDARWQATEKLLAFLPEYEAEQQRVKLYGFDYMEYLHLFAKMAQKSKLDPMTGLLNKSTFEFLVDEYFKRRNEACIAALLLIDMDHFKQINDTLGHLAGDVVLSDMASVIRRFFKEDTLCGRAGDEFMVFVKDVRDISSLLLQAEFLRQEISKTTSERSITTAIQASVGVAISTAGCYDYAGIFATAYEALCRAKKEGRNKICVIE